MQFRPCLQHGFVRNAAVDPNIDRVGAMGGAFWQTELAGKIDIVQFEPNVRAALRDEIGELANVFCIENRFPIHRIKNWKRHPPTALT